MRSRNLLIFILWLVIILVIANYLNAFVYIDPIKIIYLVLLFILTRFIWAFNWMTIHKSSGLKHDYRILINATFVSSFTDFLTPPLLPSAEIATSYYLKEKFDGKFKKYLAVMLSQSVLITMSQLMLFSLVGFFLFTKYYYPQIILFFILSIISLSLILFLLVNNKSLAVLSHILFRRLTYIDELINQMLGIFNSKFLVLRLLIIYMLGLSIEGLSVYILIDSTKVDLSIILFAFLGSLLISLISLVPGGLGVYEVSFFIILSYIQVPVSDIFSSIVLYRAVFFWLNILIGGYISNVEILKKIKK